MPVSDELKSNIRSKLSIIRNNFLRKNNGTYILENCISINGTTPEFGKSVLNKIIDYSSFIADTSILSNPQITGPGDLNRIKVLQTNGVYDNATAAILSNVANSSLQTNKFNLAEFYSQNLKNLLNAFVQNYNLVRDNWVIFKSGLPVNLKGYTPSSVTTQLNVTVSTYANSANSLLKTNFELDSIINDEGINLFASQRMLLLMVLITEIYTTMRLYQLYTGTDTNVQQALTNLLLNKINILLEINSSSSSSQY